MFMAGFVSLRAVRARLSSGPFLGRRGLRVTAVVTAGVLFSTLAVSAASATPDWNLGNTEQSQISNINAQANGVVRNSGLGKCLDDLSGNTANGSTVDTSACSGSTNQNWTFTPYQDYYWDLGFHGTVTLNNAPGKCLDVGSTNGGAAVTVAAGGTLQMLLTTSGEVYAKSGVGLGGWTKESDFQVQAIAAGSDGTQMMIGADASLYARSSIGAGAWTAEGGSMVKAISANGGVQMYLGNDGTVYARSGIGAASGWTAESATGSTAISVGSDGTQMMIGSDGAVYARSSIGASSGWTKELAPGAKEITTNGGVQMLVGSDGKAYAKTGIGLGGWVLETSIPTTDPAFSAAIAAGSDGTQMVIGNDNYAYARKGVAYNGWTKEGGPLDVNHFGTTITAGSAATQMIVLSSGVVDARTGIAVGGWTTESDLTTDTANGRPAQLSDCNGWLSQQWLFQHDKTGSLQLYNPNSGRCLDTPYGSTANGVALQIYSCNGSVAQQFNPPAAPPAPSGPITNTVINKCAVPASTTAAATAGTAVVLFGCGVGYTAPSCTSGCVTGPVLPWALNADGTLMAAGLCLGLAGGESATANGALVQMATCAGGLDQQWVVGFDANGKSRLVNSNSGRCLDDPGATTTNGIRLQIWDCNNFAQQVWAVPHAGHTFVGPAAVTTSTLPPGTGDINARIAAMDTAASTRDTQAHLAQLLHAGGTQVRTAAAQALAGPDSALTSPWSTWEQSSWVKDPNGPLAQDVASAATADQGRQQRVDGISHFLDGYPTFTATPSYGSAPDFNTAVTTFMSKDSTYWLASNAVYDPLPITHADQAAKDKVTAIAAAHAAQDPTNAWVWNLYRDQTNSGSADDVRRFIQYDGWPTVAPVAGTPEFRVEVEALKARWAGGDPSNPLDPNHMLLGAEETAWAEWQAELNAQAQPRADVLAAEMQALDALKAGAETMHDGLDYAWTAGGILWAQGQKTTGNPVWWSGVDMSHASHDLGLIKAKVAALASAAQNEAAIAQDAANKAVAARDAAYATASAAGLPEGRGLTYALQSVQVTKAAAAAAQATSNAMQTAVAATNATLADSATLLANASAQAHAARALYLRQTAQENAAQAQALATQAANQATAAAAAATVVANDKAKIATVEAAAKSAQARADAAAADAANQQTIAANAEATAQTQRNNAASAAAAAQQQAATAATKQAAAANDAGNAANDATAAQQAASNAGTARAKAETARQAMDAAWAKSAAADAADAAAQGTSAAAAADAAAKQARMDADAASVAADQANTDANTADTAAAASRAAATVANAAAAKSASDAATANAAANQTHANAVQGDALAADAIAQAGVAAQQAEAAQATAKQAQTDADNAKAAALAAAVEAAGAQSDAATATGQALATAQAAQAAAAEAATVAAPANQAIDLSAPYAATDSAAGLATLTSEAAKTMAQQQADVAAAEAAQAAALAAAAQAAANAAAGDAKLAAQAAADAAKAAAAAAASASAAMASAAQAASDAAATKASSDRINAMDARAQLDAVNANASAQVASNDAAAASAAATASETDAAAAHSAANSAQESANGAQNSANQAQTSDTAAQQAAATAQADATAAQQAADAVTQQQQNQQSSQLTSTAGAGISGVAVLPVNMTYGFTPTTDCVGTGTGSNVGCDITGVVEIKGYDVYTLITCPVPGLSADACIGQYVVDVLGVVPVDISVTKTIHVNGWELTADVLKNFAYSMVSDFVNCAKGNAGDCAWAAATLLAPVAIKVVAEGAIALRAAILVGDVTSVDSALAALRASAISASEMAKLEWTARWAKLSNFTKDMLSCVTPAHSFAAGTPVEMADGTVRAIQDVRVGDSVRNAVPGGGEQTHRVTATHITYTDTEFTDLTLNTADGPRTITSTQNHPYFDLSSNAFVEASRLNVGDRLQTSGTGSVTVSAARDYVGTKVTYDLTIDGLHTYYVVAGNTPVLVHNMSCGVYDILLGRADQNLTSIAADLRKETLMNFSTQDAKDLFLMILNQNPDAKWSVSLDGFDGTTVQEKFMNAVTVGMRPGASVTQWEMTQLWLVKGFGSTGDGTLGNVTFYEFGKVVPWG
jgi:hypothetical protein